MAFIVEDGTVVADANSYVAVEFADSYFADRGNAAWAALTTDAEKEVLLVQATDYVEAIFGRRFIGEMNDPAQPLSWPRIDTGDYVDPAFGDNEIPPTLMKAICQYALQALSGPLQPTPAIDATGFSVVTTRKAVGPIEKEFRVIGNSSRPAPVRSYPAADALMGPLLIPTSGGVIR